MKHFRGFALARYCLLYFRLFPDNEQQVSFMEKRIRLVKFWSIQNKVIYYWRDPQQGWIPHSQKGRGVTLISKDRFFNGHEVDTSQLRGRHELGTMQTDYWSSYCICIVTFQIGILKKQMDYCIDVMEILGYAP